MKTKLSLISVFLAVLAFGMSCNPFFSPHEGRAQRQQVSVRVSGGISGTGSRKGLVGDGSVASVEIAVKDPAGRAIGPGGTLQQHESYWSGNIDVGGFTGPATFYATAKDGDSKAIYRGWASATLRGSGDSVSIAVTTLKGLVGEWLFSGNASDSAGSNDGTVNGATLAADRFGSLNSAYGFDGGSSIGFPITGLPTRSSPVTVSLWIQAPAVSGYPFRCCFSYGSGASGSAFGILLKPNTATSNTIGLTNYNGDFNGSEEIPVGSWNHIVMASDGTTVVIYINGELDGSGACPLSTSPTDGHIGTWVDESGSFVGTIDDVRVYSKALSPSEIADLYAEGGWPSPGGLTRSGLVGEWLFSGNANDRSGEGHDGTAHGNSGLAPDRFGKADSAYHFDGTNGYVNIPGFTGTYNSISYSFWLRSTGSGTVGPPRAIRLNRNTVFECGDYSQNSLNGYINNAGIFTGAIEQGAWHNIIVSHDGSTAIVYEDGSQSATSAGSAIAIDALQVGGDSDMGRFFNGDVDDLRMYNRALTASEVAQLYHEDGWANGAPSAGFHFIGYYGGHQYWVSKAKASWQAAFDACRAVGGHLATIGSPGENEYASIAANKIGVDGEGVWIGLDDIALEGTFVWVTGEAATYANWDSGEPNDSGGVEDAVYICGPGCPNWHSIGKWNDSDPANSWYYLLEVE